MTSTTATTGTLNTGTIVTQAADFDLEVWVTVGKELVSLTPGQAEALAAALQRAAADARNKF